MINEYTREKINEQLKSMEHAPAMFASTKEAFLSSVVSFMIIADFDNKFDVTVFYKKYLGTSGSIYVGTLESVTKEWATPVIEEALEFVENYEEIS